MKPPLTISRGVLRLRRSRGYSPEYLIHQLVADWFGDRDDRGYLYRVTARPPREAHVLVLSDEPPVDDPPAREWGETVRVESKPFAPELTSGQELDYELHINATRVVTQPNGKKKRTDIWDAVFHADCDDPRTPHDVYAAYLRRKLDGAAEVMDARVTERGQTRIRRANRSRPILFIVANLIGTLRVTDPDTFLDTVAHGIGRAKAFGCGMLCLSRPGTILPRKYSTPLEL